MENNALIIREKEIKNKIYTIRGQKVMLDSDLAEIYGYETKNFNRQVRNNIEKFDEDFMFQLTKEEVEQLSRCNFFTSSLDTNNYGGRRYLPYAFTEQGVAMLATILKTKIAIQVSIDIMDAFVMMRKYISTNNYMIKLDI